MNAHKIRSIFLKFFESQDHTLVPSSSVVPENDPTLLFTNAGMNQFKDVLLGHEKRDYVRATSTQKCVRAGGKHNDLDDVGKDARHLTFFEMLGNWSFGDYYKRDSILWAWDLIKNHLKLDVSRVYVTIYKDDDESFDIWHKEVGLEPERILRLGDIAVGNEENFWSMGPTGPCGPCTEMHYDLYPEWGPLKFEVGYDEERIIEFWNIVFMEFNRDEDGVLHPLAMRSVDTGMGLERMAMIMAGKPTVFHTELFTPIFKKVCQLLGESEDLPDTKEFYEQDRFPDFAVIGDHIRTVTFSLADGAKFSNEGRGSVLRSILRRAVRHGLRLGFDKPFLFKVAEAVVANFKDIFPEIVPLAENIYELIQIEEERFFHTVESGVELFEAATRELKETGKTIIPGEVVFKLHATHGFPPDLTRRMAEDEGFELDMDGYQKEWKDHQEASKGEKDVYAEVAQLGDWVTVHESNVHSQFVGYHDVTSTSNLLKFRHIDGDRWELLLDKTPFYAESGGQVADHGTIQTEDGSLSFFVTDVQKSHIGSIHRAKLVHGVCNKETCAKPVHCEVDKRRRQSIMANHTATHLLHKALRTIVSDQIFQAGSLVAPDRLRFDFRYEKPLTAEEIRRIEDSINDQIADGLPVKHHYDVDREAAVSEMGAMAIFGEKYGDRVRVIEVQSDNPDVLSVELCGGTHVHNTRDIQLFEITSETGIAAGIRRIEALTGLGAIQASKERRQILDNVAHLLKSDVQSVTTRLQNILDDRQELSRQVDKLSQKLAAISSGDILNDAKEINGVKVVAHLLHVDTREQLLAFADKLREKLTNGVVLLGAIIDAKPALLCMTSEDFWKAHKVKAGDLVNEAARFVDGRGGGRPTLAQAGGSKPEGLQEALDAFESIVSKHLSA